MAPDPSKLRDYCTRTKGPSPVGTSLVLGLRLLGRAFTYAIIADGLNPRR